MQKIKSLMSRQVSKSFSENLSESALQHEPPKTPHKEELPDTPCNPEAEQEVIDSIEKVYFDDEAFDPVRYELEKLPEVMQLAELEEYRDRLKRQQAVVSKKVADLILEKQSAYVQELSRVTELQTSLHEAKAICCDGRGQLGVAQQGFTAASLGLLANQRKRQLLIGLLKSLRTIKTLQRTDVRLSEMLEEEDFPAAIQLCLECQNAVSSFSHYSCISELNSKLQDTLEQIEEQLDVALAKTCKLFDVVHYTKVQTAYRLLDKTQTAMDQMHMHFTQAIHNTAFQVVLGYVELCASGADTRFHKLQYKDLCSHVTVDSYIPCMTDLCKALWEVMHSYYQTMEWHREHDGEVSLPEAEEPCFDRSYVQKKLEHGLTRIWQDVQQKVKTYILGTDLAHFKYDDFIFVLDIINRLMDIGDEFCSSKSEGLQESIRKQSLNYFKNYHRTRMEELRMFLENEAWELCPVRSNFSIFQLHEFKFLAQGRGGGVGLVPTSSPSKMAATPGATPTTPVIGSFPSHCNPFESLRQDQDDDSDDVLAANGYDSEEGEKSPYQDEDSDSDVADELKRDFVDEQTGETPVRSVSKDSVRVKRKSESHYSLNKMNAPILANTTLNFIRLFGRYLQMMSVLQPIAFDVVQYMSQLFDYYLYAVYTFFGREHMFETTGLGLISNRLRTTLNRIQESLIDQEAQTDPVVSVPEERREKVPCPHLSRLVDLIRTDTLYGLAERIVATESLVFLAEQFEFLQNQLDAMIPQAKKPFLQQFYSQTVSTVGELRKPVYWMVAAKAIDYEHALLLMAGVKWDVREIMSQHSPYVDSLLKEFEAFSRRLAEISKRVRIPVPVSNVLWEHCIRLANRTLVEGFASAKKCSTEGRALMQLDFQQFLLKLERLTDLRPIPDKDYVETYIKAYYLTEGDMERWIKEHREYSSRQLNSLVNVCVGTHINKRAKQRLLTAIDESDRPKR
ncbi:syndetin isoform X1 [Lethenteron reissneri]|uniref:syndetin isoform X1 n=1 Tax=Lethenteron reissneri TaxID=7753 RepID=UPI002AB713B6|nr:syndetin isoform X1 [Lethenteron reissneri]